ncbi:hypothetical protein V6N12_051272 [Hibiscus sabdariffa]|uniref:Uncharacterized protein n=1 Tax=Hibiscus sabdariffa TaxID=183260 RepID=A0ABR2GEU1_9ROSI
MSMEKNGFMNMYSKCGGLGDLVRELEQLIFAVLSMNDAEIDRNLNEIDVSEILVGASVKENVMASIMNVNDFVMSLALYITDNNLLETTYEILLACAFEDLIVPSKGKEDKRFRLIKMLG